jgi:hypothetical protein
MSRFILKPGLLCLPPTHLPAPRKARKPTHFISQLGGFMSNSKVAGSVQSGSQQQWLNRNVEIGGGFPQGVWNMVFVGCTGAPEVIPTNWPTT